MTTQNLHTGPLRSSGHKEATEDHATVGRLESQGDSGDPEALLQNRLLNNSQVARAALYDESDFLCVASSKQRFNLQPDNVRKILDGLLTYSRQGDPTFASGDGPPPKRLNLGEEGHVDVKDANGDYIVATLNDRPFIAARTATYVLLVEGADGSNQGSLESTVQSFQEGLQSLAL